MNGLAQALVASCGVCVCPLRVSCVCFALCAKVFVRACVIQSVRDGICVDQPLCRGTSQGIYGSRIIGLTNNRC